ncbi:MAG: cyclic nucleotide-binding protein, partial [Sphingobacteriales bacterium BACL12 MAG-120813-bin55]
MERIRQVMQQMITVSDEELNNFLSQAFTKTFKRQEIVSRPQVVPNEIFFMNKGLIRVVIADNAGQEHTIHFALEDQFISDYSNFMLQQPSFYTLQALEETEVIVLPRTAIDWGYKNLQEGEKMGRLIAEYYFIYQDNRIKNTYS